MDRDDIIRIEVSETTDEVHQLQILVAVAVFFGLVGYFVTTSWVWAGVATAISSAVLGIGWLVVVRWKDRNHSLEATE